MRSASRIFAGPPSLFEPGLEESVQGGPRERQDPVRKGPVVRRLEAEAVLVAFDTPVDENDDVDLTILEEAFRTIDPRARRDSLVIVNSQVPAGRCEGWLKDIDDARPGESIDLVYSPENLRLDRPSRSSSGRI